MFVELVFPLPFRNTFTYSVPAEFISYAKTGSRAVAPFGRRTLTGFIVNTFHASDLINHESLPAGKIKPISDVPDEKPIFTKKSLKFYEWLADYYLSSPGEALRLGVPSGIEIESKRKIIIDQRLCENLLLKEKKTTTRFRILEILCGREEMNFNHLQKLVGKRNIYASVRSLENDGAVTVLDETGAAKVKIKKEKFVKLSKTIGEIYAVFPELESRSPKQVKILLELINRKNKTVPLNYLLKKAEASSASAESLQQKGFIEISEKEVNRDYVNSYKETFREIIPTDAQQKIIDTVSEPLNSSSFKTYLLHGVTGSGKTQVYIELVKMALAMGKSALILVPEISLTPQMTSRMYNNFGDTVSVQHSRMSPGERYDAWRKILKGKAKVIIGARSALFSPIKDLGLIVVDEEHDASYKQTDSPPKYHARDAAIVLGQIMECPVVLGSATPSVESMYNAVMGKYELLELTERIDNARMPVIKLINVAVERKKKKMENVFSRTLIDHISDRLKKKEGVIILQNRRGFSTQIYCEDCGEIESCDNCSVPMVYHINKNMLQCHYCGLTKKVPNACTHCGSLNIKYFGTGTERVEDEIEYYFPNASIKRIDSDSINKKNVLSNILQSFGSGAIDILVGTQMVSKGLDFSRVTLVGVISAETTLWLPDFRADERTFQLLTQVAGRAGRSSTAGEVIIQTQNEKNFTLQRVLMNDYRGFYQREIFSREKMGYPPFTRLCIIETKDKNEEKAKGAAEDFHSQLIRYKKYLKITSVTPAAIARLKGEYRYQILIKSSKETDPGSKILKQAVINSFMDYNRKSRYRDVKLSFDVDPQSIL
ncbi:MAG TPA: primosomal protein N' [Ignavibacteriaceae bacterium]|nr:primosomal protein N' [Ignavibacteriaceae bacterium]